MLQNALEISYGFWKFDISNCSSFPVMQILVFTLHATMPPNDNVWKFAHFCQKKNHIEAKDIPTKFE